MSFTKITTAGAGTMGSQVAWQMLVPCARQRSTWWCAA
jgi:hypothetical protein